MTQPNDPMMAHVNAHDHERIYWIGRLSALIPGMIFVWIAFQIPDLATGRPLQISWHWVPSLNVELTFFLDGLSGLMCLIITGIGALVLIYADAYFRFVDDARGRGVEIPIVPGIMPIASFSKLARFSDTCGAEIPR